MSMFKRYKSSHETESKSSSPSYGGEEKARGAYSPDSSSEPPPRIYDHRTPLSPQAAARVRMQEREDYRPQPVREEEEEAVKKEPVETPPPFPTNYEGAPEETTLSEQISITGTLKFSQLLRIDGYFEGELISDGKLTVGPKGTVKANISMQEAVIEGYVEGDIQVKRVELRRKAQVKGNITAETISVDEGVKINGQVSICPVETEVSSET